MKKNRGVMGIFCLALVLGLGLAACKDEPKDESTELEGTWELGDKKLIFSGKNFTQLEGEQGSKGTFTLEGDKITLTITNMSVDGGKNWLSIDQFIEEILKELIPEWDSMSAEAKKEAIAAAKENEFGESSSMTMTYELSEDKKTLTIDGEDLKKV